MVVIGLLPFVTRANELVLTEWNRQNHWRRFHAHTSSDRDVAHEQADSCDRVTGPKIESWNYEAGERELLLRRRAKRVTGTGRRRMERISAGEKIGLAAVRRKRGGVVCA